MRPAAALILALAACAPTVPEVRLDPAVAPPGSCYGMVELGSLPLGPEDGVVEDIITVGDGLVLAFARGEEGAGGTGELLWLQRAGELLEISDRQTISGHPALLLADGQALLVGKRGGGLSRLDGQETAVAFPGETITGMDWQGPDGLVVSTDQQRLATLHRAGEGWSVERERGMPHRFLPAGVAVLEDRLMVPIYFHSRLLVVGPQRVEVHALAGSATIGNDHSRLRAHDGSAWMPLPRVGLQRWSATGEAELVLREDPGAWDLVPKGADLVLALGKGGVGTLQGGARCALGGEVRHVAVLGDLIVAGAGPVLHLLRLDPVE